MAAKPITENTLFYGDNLPILHEYVADESIDLIYLDPPFNSKRTYNVLFKDESGLESEAQIAAFDDTWHWNRAAEQTYHELVTQAPEHVSRMIAALREFIGTNQMMAYLVMMTIRLVELHRVLKSTGSLYLHCDPTASHYLKIILDTIFGPANFRNEIIWKRTFAHGSSKRYGPVHDVILFYSKTDDFVWTDPRKPHSEDYIERHFKLVDPATGRRFQAISLTGAGTRRGYSGKPWRGIDPTAVGRHWAIPARLLEKLGIQAETTQDKLDALDAAGMIYWPQKEGGVPRLKLFADEVEITGVALPDAWDDIHPIGAQAKERLGYPTQKPLALLERIIQASSNPDDWVLDPFCGCGTAVAVAQKLGRRWIGVDITHLAITLQRYRLKEMFPGASFKVIGEPQSVAAAQHLAQQNRFQFEWWALSLVRARPTGGQRGSKRGKKGADRGIDGVITFIDEAKRKPKRVLVQVKSGKVSSRDIRDLRGTVEREKAAIGVLITLDPPTSAMEKEAVSAGFYHSPWWQRDFPKIQILRIDQLLNEAQVQMPPGWGTFKRARLVKKMDGVQAELEM